MDGYELARAAARERAGQPCTLVALTGYGQASDASAHARPASTRTW